MRETTAARASSRPGAVMAAELHLDLGLELLGQGGRERALQQCLGEPQRLARHRGASASARSRATVPSERLDDLGHELRAVTAVSCVDSRRRRTIRTRAPRRSGAARSRRLRRPASAPTVANAGTNRASVEAMRMSAAQASASPAPAATPLTAAITGLRRDRQGEDVRVEPNP